MKIPIEIKAISYLKAYNGTNDYIISLKNKYLKNNSFNITKTQAKYVIDNIATKPIIFNKFVDIHKSCREYLQKQLGLPFLPEKIFINKLLSRDEDLLQIWGCFNDDCEDYELIYITKQCIRAAKQIKQIDFSKYDRQPKEHQITAINALLANDKYILADQMGLGKTTSAIIAAIEGNFKKILVVCPASLKLNWKKEISYYDDPNNISIIDGSGFRVKKWTIINYDILKNYHYTPRKGVKIEELSPSAIDFHKFDLVIADEAHYLKSATSSRSKIFNDFVKRIPNRWLLTGTPITNKPIDFYNLLFICESPVANNWVHYAKRYCAGKQFSRKTNEKNEKKKYWVTSGASNLDELHEYTTDIMLRRTKKDSINLPQKTIKPIYLPQEGCLNYKAYLQEYYDWVENTDHTETKPTLSDHLTKLIKIRQLLSFDKIQHTIELIEDLIDNDQKVVVFSCFTQSINEIHEHFGKASVIIDGSVSKEKRQLAVDKFQTDDKIKVFCGNIIAAGVGLTLTEGTVVIFNDLDWVPANHAQAEDRIHRIGQENDVHIIYLLFDDTLDTLMYDSLQRKIKVINKVMGDSAEMNEENITNEVINNFLKNKN